MVHTKPITFSVVIPAYNEARTIGICIDHVCSQEGDFEYEIIVVDNNSTDGTGDIARAKGVSVVLEKRPGVGAARRTGTEHARGMYIMHIDADTHLPSDYFVQVKKRFDVDEKLVCVGGQMYYYDAPLWKNILRVPVHWVFWFFARMVSFGRVGPMGNNMTFKKAVYDQTDGFNSDLRYGEDIDVCKQMSQFGVIRLDMSLKCFVSVRRFTFDTQMWRYMFNFFKMCITGHPHENRLEKLDE